MDHLRAAAMSPGLAKRACALPTREGIISPPARSAGSNQLPQAATQRRQNGTVEHRIRVTLRRTSRARMTAALSAAPRGQGRHEPVPTQVR